MGVSQWPVNLLALPPPVLQCVPAGAQPLLCSSGTHDTSLQAPSEFEDIAQMIEWLILIESKLQPDKMVGGDIVQMKGMLRELMVSGWVFVCMSICIHIYLYV